MPGYHAAFISHAHTDNARCATIAARLREKGVDVWIDLTNAQQGHDLGGEIDEELERRTAFILMVTATSNASHWVQMERGAFIALLNTPRTRLVNGVERMMLPVRLSDEVPAILRGILWIDGVGKPDEQVADEIAAALAIPMVSDGSEPDERDTRQGENRRARAGDWDEIGIHARLYDLGFRGWRSRATGAEFVLPPIRHVMAGSFLMGSADDDAEADDDEKPQYRVPVGEYAISAYPLTVEEYRAYLSANPHVAVPPKYIYPKEVGRWSNAARGAALTWEQQQLRPDHPVVCVSWFNARDYAAWLARVTGQRWRAPTEAEWEKAARWDATRQHAQRYPWGDEWDATRLNCGETGLGHTTPVGAYPSGASPCGAYDMAGNVWEWCSSLYQTRYPYTTATCEDGGRDKSRLRVLRGGSWYDNRRDTRTTIRYAQLRSGEWNVNAGFRLALG